jgi:hypothetical protein
MLSPAIRMAVMIAIMLIIYTLMLYIGGQGSNKYMGWISYLLMTIGLWLATKNYRDVNQLSNFSFGNAFKMSFLISLFTALFYGVFTYFYFKFLARDMMQELITITEQELLNNTQINEDQAEQAMKFYKKYVFIPFSLAIVNVFSFMIVGAILSLIVAGITQQKSIETPQD